MAGILSSHRNSPVLSTDLADATSDSLVWLGGPNGRVPVHASCSIGRSASNRLALPGDRISRRHAMIQQQGPGDFWLLDLGSRNGTWLNGARVTQATRLYDQDRINIGPYELVFRQSNGRQRTRPEFTVAERTMQEVKTVPCWLLVSRLVAALQGGRPPSSDEAARAMDRWLDECKETLDYHGGHLHKYLGDGFLACWYHHAGAAAAVADALRALRQRQMIGAPPFRLVLHHGVVIARSLAHFREESLSGLALHFAFRMEKLAAALRTPALVSEAARNLLECRLPLREIGPQDLEGFESDVQFYEL